MAAPSAARSSRACLMAAAAEASTPQVGWLTASTSGFCSISRPMTNFCRLPPESERAATWGPGVRTSKASITSSA